MLLRIEFTAMGSFQPSGELLPRLSTLTSFPVRGKAVSLCCTFPGAVSYTHLGEIGRVHYVAPKASEDYIDHLVSTVDSDLAGLRILVDLSLIHI